MSILNWFRQLTKPAAAGQAAPVPAPQSDKGAEVGGLNFKSAVDAHMKWKVRLESYINGTSTEDLKVEVVGCDDKCPLGKWIYAEGGRRFGYSETFFEMKAHHAHFHRSAGAVLATAQGGDKTKALYLLHHGDYVRASERVKQLLARLFVLVADGKTAIDAHIKWKTRLRDYINGDSSETLDAAVVSRDDQCVLGHWLQGVGREHYGQLPAFKEVVEKHARFHRCAGDVLEAAKAGGKARAIEMLDEGEYAQASEDITDALVKLFSIQNGATTT